jgi:hypothetical protein
MTVHQSRVILFFMRGILRAPWRAVNGQARKAADFAPNERILNDMQAAQ